MIPQVFIDILVILITFGIFIVGAMVAYLLYAIIYVYLLEPFQLWIRSKINGKKHSI